VGVSSQCTVKKTTPAKNKHADAKQEVGRRPVVHVVLPNQIIIIAIVKAPPAQFYVSFQPQLSKERNPVNAVLTPAQPESVTLYYKEGSSDKVYQCSIEPAGDLFTVNFSYGRRGTTLNTGTKTNVPVPYDNAKRIFDKLVKEKQAKGYSVGEDGTPYQHTDQQPSGLLPQLLNPIEEPEVLALIKDDNFCAQEKFDGRRMLVNRESPAINGINKKGNLVGLPEPLFKVIHQFEVDLVLDGESVGDNYYAFDLLTLDGKDIRSWPYRERLTALMNLLFSKQQRIIKLVHTAFTTQQKQSLFDQLRKGKREGIVFKRLDAPYTAGRPNSGGSQLKHKFVASLSAVVAKVNAQRSVEIRLLNGEGWVGAGNVTIPANQNIPIVGAVVEVRYLYAHKPSGCLYQPVYLGLRDDVQQHDCVTSQLKFKPEEAE
jgi:bifunctional non-homologous end joining protein LigD